MSDIVTEYLKNLPEHRRKILVTPEGRRAATKYDFQLFAFTYFRDVMRSSDTGGSVTLSEFHEAFLSDSKRYVRPAGPSESRTAWICPRGSGKSSWIMMLVIWMAAHQHQSFISIFSATPSQAEDQLANIRGHFDGNELLRRDYPTLVRAATRKAAALKLSDNKSMIIQQNGTIITGRGINTSVLGLRIDNRRPSVLVLDDVEAGESQTASTDIAKLLVTIQDDIFPLSLNAHVLWVGTTTRPKGLTESLVHAALGMDHDAWVEDENFSVNYWPALKTADDGTEYSIWEERWSTEYLIKQKGTRSFRKNYMCLPAPDDYPWWTPDVFQYGNVPELDYVMLSVDPAVTVEERSDQTGLSVVGYSKATRKTYVLYCEGVRMDRTDLRKKALKIIETFPSIMLIYAEVNQGGNLIVDMFSGLGVRIKTVHQSVPKKIRASTALAEYEKGNVIHARKFNALEDQMIAFDTKGVHDDLVDSVGSAVLYFAEVSKGSAQIKVSSGTYK